jgi:hypothetical protein
MYEMGMYAWHGDGWCMYATGMYAWHGGWGGVCMRCECMHGTGMGWCVHGMGIYAWYGNGVVCAWDGNVCMV